MAQVYKQQKISGDRYTSFRNSDDEPWIVYKTAPYAAVLSFGPEGYYPQPEWARVDV